MWYLAYGMNTNIQSMRLRCPKAQSLGKVVLKDYRLVFKNFCDAVKSPGDNLECALWYITADCEQSLDALEGYPDFYGKREVLVQNNDRTLRAMIYTMTGEYSTSVNDNLKAPSDSYLSLVVDGYANHYLSIGQLIQALEEVESCTSYSDKTPTSN